MDPAKTGQNSKSPQEYETSTAESFTPYGAASQMPSQIFSDYVGTFSSTSTSMYAPDNLFAPPNYDQSASVYAPAVDVGATASYSYTASFAMSSGASKSATTTTASSESVTANSVPKAAKFKPPTKQEIKQNFPVYIPTPINKEKKTKKEEYIPKPAEKKIDKEIKVEKNSNTDEPILIDDDDDVQIVKEKKGNLKKSKKAPVFEEDLFGDNGSEKERPSTSKRHKSSDSEEAPIKKKKGEVASFSKKSERESFDEEDSFPNEDKKRIARAAPGTKIAAPTRQKSHKNFETQLAERNKKFVEEMMSKEKEKLTQPKKPPTQEELYGEKKKEMKPMSVSVAKLVAEKVKPKPGTSSSKAGPSSGKPENSSKVDFKAELKDIMSRKVPLQTRISNLKLLFWQLLDYFKQAQAMKMAVDEEKAILDKCLSSTGYTVAVRNAITRIRKENAEGAVEKKEKCVSHLTNLHGSKLANVSIGSGERRLPQTENEIYNAIRQMRLSENQLIENCYPHWEDASKLKAKIQPSEFDLKLKRKLYAEHGDLTRNCCRCGTVFRLLQNEDGSRTVAKDACKYHGRKKMLASWRRGEGPRARVPECCQDPNQPCMMAEKHVFDTLPAYSLTEFVESPKPISNVDDRSRKIYALDCEMVYTMDGPALARVTVVDIHNNPKLDEIVRPPSEVIDCNTKYSGITMDMIQKATETLTSIQSRLFEFINSETILIGHSLESDLKTLRIIHSNVVDTAVLFMGGRPQKPSLANLASDLLMRFIQQDEPGQVGHSSLEDSIVCMDLVLLKIGFKKRAI